jgi:hypothetical protein
MFGEQQIDRFGRIIDIDRNKGKLNIIEQEFKSAERAEQQRQREEEEGRVRWGSDRASCSIANFVNFSLLESAHD